VLNFRKIIGFSDSPRSRLTNEVDSLLKDVQTVQWRAEMGALEGIALWAEAARIEADFREFIDLEPAELKLTFAMKATLRATAHIAMAGLGEIALKCVDFLSDPGTPIRVDLFQKADKHLAEVIDELQLVIELLGPNDDGSGPTRPDKLPSCIRIAQAYREGVKRLAKSEGVSLSLELLFAIFTNDADAIADLRDELTSRWRLKISEHSQSGVSPNHREIQSALAIALAQLRTIALEKSPALYGFKHLERVIIFGERRCSTPLVKPPTLESSPRHFDWSVPEANPQSTRRYRNLHENESSGEHDGFLFRFYKSSQPGEFPIRSGGSSWRNRSALMTTRSTSLKALLQGRQSRNRSVLRLFLKRLSNSSAACKRDLSWSSKMATNGRRLSCRFAHEVRQRPRLELRSGKLVPRTWKRTAIRFDLPARIRGTHNESECSLLSDE
jgi:hypothetical protein